MIKFLKSKYIWLIALFIIVIPSYRFLLHPGLYWNMHDDMQIIRQLEYDKCLKDGQFPCRWSPDLGYGYGYPEFNFYPPLPYMVGEIFRVFQSPYMEIIKYTAIVNFILAAFAMYFFVTEVTNSRLAGFFSAVFYTYAPYRAINTYVRGAMNESWATVFFPLIFLYVYKVVKQPSTKNIIYLAISIFFLLLCHNPMVMIFAPFCLLWSFYCIKLFHQSFFSSIGNLTKSALLSVLLSAFFTIPVLFEAKYVQIDSMFTNYYTFYLHFKSLYQIFISNFWGDGPSVWGGGDGMSFMIGYLHWIIPLLITIYFVYFSIKNKKINLASLLPFLLTMSGLFCLFMIHSKSTFIWFLIKPLKDIQFPWRFLNPATFLLSFAAGFLPLILKKHLSPILNYSVAFILIVAVMAINWKHFYPVTYGPLTDQQKFSGIAWRNLVTSGIYDYLPKTASMAAQKPATEYVDGVLPSTVKYALSGQEHGTDWLSFEINSDQPGKYIISQLAYPGFKTYIDNQDTSYNIEPLLGRITLNIPAGDHYFFLKLTDTHLRSIANYLSLISWLIIIVYFVKSSWKPLPLKK